MKEVTDPALLEQLNGGSREVTDPAILAQLNASVIDPTKGMIWIEKALAGAGKAYTDIGRGAKQSLVGQEGNDEFFVGTSLQGPERQKRLAEVKSLRDESRKQIQDEINESRRLDAPLMRTGGGITGNIIGNIFAALPSMAVPGANTIIGSAGIGGLYGMVQPTTEEESRLKNTLLGAAISGGTTAAVKGVAGAYRGVKSLVEPFTKSGQEKIAARVLKEAAGDSLGAGYKSPVTGVQPTLAESTLNPGVATLQRGAQSADPQVAAALAERQLQNNAARVNALRSIAGDDVALEAAKSARNSASSASYDTAKAQVVKIDDALQKLLSRPSMAKAWEKAQQIAIENGDDLAAPGSKDVSVKTLHYLKMGLDDMLDSAPSTGLGRNEQSAIQSTKKAFLGWLENVSPEYGQGRQAYASASKPITQMEVARELIKKGGSAAEDAMGNPTLYPESFNRAVRDSEKVVRAAGGLRSQGLQDVLTPEQLKTIQGIASDLSRQQSAQNLGRSVGSNTAQNLSSQNFIKQSGIPNLVSKPLSALRWLRPLDFTEQDTAVRQKLAEVLLDPEKAQQLLSNLEPGQAAKLAEVLKTYALPPAGASILPGILGTQSGQQ